MRRLRFDLMRAEEELAGARQCILCLCSALLTAAAALLLWTCDLLPPWGPVVAAGTVFLLVLTGAACACLAGRGE